MSTLVLIRVLNKSFDLTCLLSFVVPVCHINYASTSIGVLCCPKRSIKIATITSDNAFLVECGTRTHSLIYYAALLQNNTVRDNPIRIYTCSQCF